MNSNAFPLRYQCRTTGKVINAKKLADQRYSILKDESSQPETVSGYSLRKHFKFLEDKAPKSSVKFKRNSPVRNSKYEITQ
jgi:hypothetical protein